MQVQPCEFVPLVRGWNIQRAQSNVILIVKLANWEDFCQVFQVQIKAALCNYCGFLTNVGMFIKQNFTLTCDFRTPFSIIHHDFQGMHSSLTNDVIVILQYLPLIVEKIKLVIID